MRGDEGHGNSRKSRCCGPPHPPRPYVAGVGGGMGEVRGVGGLGGEIRCCCRLPWQDAVALVEEEGDLTARRLEEVGEVGEGGGGKRQRRI